MPYEPPLPKVVQQHLRRNTHPGLMLDKYACSWDPEAPKGKLSEKVQRPTLDGVARLSRAAPEGIDFGGLARRRQSALDEVQSRRLTAVTTGPLTLHLARASALENAGICLHPLYGFVYLPGTGVKGLAHAFACEVWLRGRGDREEDFDLIGEVFGHAPSKWLDDLARQHGVGPPEGSRAGAVVFHDAWPDSWPRLTVDILNSHHATYYRGEGPPGDWDNPVPVYFLSVSAGQAFTFAVSGRRGDARPELIDLACQWLAGGLEHLGAGAKTATGYGAFKVSEPAAASRGAGADKDAAVRLGKREEFACSLKLVTPAFLAGANQQEKEDCELRPATLRGLLRWWWRTLHAGYIDVPTLRGMEAAVWGDTEAGGAVRLLLQPAETHVPLPFDRNDITRKNNLPVPPNRKTTQGLTYHSFGMNDTKTEDGVKVATRRFFLPPGCRWQLGLVARRSGLGAGDLLDQAKAALWLLCHFGGVGAKSRKGFGSLAEPPELADWDLEVCKAKAREFRSAFGAGDSLFRPGPEDSPSLEEILPFDDIPLGWPNYWMALDQLAAGAQTFAQQHKHQREKKALGLPRNVDRGASGTFRPGQHVQNRHASPVLYHFSEDDRGLVLRVTAFPAGELPDRATSKAFLTNLLEHLRETLPGRYHGQAAGGRTPPVNPPPTGGPGGPTPPRAVKSGDRVRAVLLPEKTGSGGWRARHPESGLTGPIVNSTDVPADKKEGDEVELIVVSDNPKNPSFRWPGAADDAKRKQDDRRKGPPPGPPRGWPPREPRGRR